MSNSFIWSIDRTQSGATTPGQSGPGRDGNKEVHHIPQSSSITEALPNRLFSVISWTFIVGVLPLYRDSVSVFCCPCWLKLEPLPHYKTHQEGFYQTLKLNRFIVFKTIPCLVKNQVSEKYNWMDLIKRATTFFWFHNPAW